MWSGCKLIACVGQATTQRLQPLQRCWLTTTAPLTFAIIIYLSIRIICSLSVLPLRPFLRTRTLPLREGDKKGSRSASWEAMPGSPISYILIRPPKIQLKSDTYLLNAIKNVARMPPSKWCNKNFMWWFLVFKKQLTRIYQNRTKKRFYSIKIFSGYSCEKMPSALSNSNSWVAIYRYYAPF